MNNENIKSAVKKFEELLIKQQERAERIKLEKDFVDYLIDCKFLRR